MKTRPDKRLIEHRTFRFRSKLSIFKGRPDLTPMIDVFFLLMIFFILCGSFVKVAGERIELPVTGRNQQEMLSKLIIGIDAKSQYYLNNQPVDWSTLSVKLGQFRNKKNFKSDTAIIMADKNASYGEVTKVISLARIYGLNVYLATGKPAPAEGGGQ